MHIYHPGYHSMSDQKCEFIVHVFPSWIDVLQLNSSHSSATTYLASFLASSSYWSHIPAQVPSRWRADLIPVLVHTHSLVRIPILVGPQSVRRLCSAIFLFYNRKSPGLIESYWNRIKIKNSALRKTFLSSMSLKAQYIRQYGFGKNFDWYDRRDHSQDHGDCN